MKLSLLLQDIIFIPTHVDKDIYGLSLDSRQIKPGYLFIAVQSDVAEGHCYIDQAIANGAGVVLQEGECTEITMRAAPVISIPQLKDKLSLIAVRFFHYPANVLRIIGITGTNGKTSCSHFIAAALQGAQVPCGVIGTIGIGFPGKLEPAQLTTPDVINLQRYFYDFVCHGAQAIAMEVSSHGIAQDRIQGIHFDIGVFTNLTRDHLDYHGNMETYATVKQRFLTSLATQQLVINADDALGLRSITLLAEKKPVYAYSLIKPKYPIVPYVYVDQVQLNLQGIIAMVYTPWGEGMLTLPLIGEFNLSNALAVLTTLCLYGIPFATALAQMAALQPVAGRMQLLGGSSAPNVVVDYAHTPDALDKVLMTLRRHCQGRLFCLFGCGGDRDQGKRPQMAKVAEQRADTIVVTNDNPRNEQPEYIVADIVKGFKYPERVLVQLDRSKAIQDIIELAAQGDWVLIAGKGAEMYQQIGATRIYFSDEEEVKRCLRR